MRERGAEPAQEAVEAASAEAVACAQISERCGFPAASMQHVPFVQENEEEALAELGTQKRGERYSQLGMREKWPTAQVPLVGRVQKKVLSSIETKDSK